VSGRTDPRAQGDAWGALGCLGALYILFRVFLVLTIFAVKLISYGLGGLSARLRGKPQPNRPPLKKKLLADWRAWLAKKEAEQDRYLRRWIGPQDDEEPRR
jgi:hypothetical protein